MEENKTAKYGEKDNKELTEEQTKQVSGGIEFVVQKGKTVQLSGKTGSSALSAAGDDANTVYLSKYGGTKIAVEDTNFRGEASKLTYSASEN